MAKKKKTGLYKLNKEAKVGETIECPICHTKFTKKQYSQAFCSTRCKDRFWNSKGDRHRYVDYPDNDFGDREMDEYQMTHAAMEYIQAHEFSDRIDSFEAGAEWMQETIIEKARKWFNLYFRQVGTPREIKHDFESKERMMNYCYNPVATKTIHKEELIRRFQFLLFYRDAYWKLYGEEIGLGKPWEPDWTNNNEVKFVIGVSENEIIECCSGIAQYVFAFPTEEMRDAFKENFDPDIEICKELL